MLTARGRIPAAGGSAPGAAGSEARDSQADLARPAAVVFGVDDRQDRVDRRIQGEVAIDHGVVEKVQLLDLAPPRRAARPPALPRRPAGRPRAPPAPASGS